MDGALLAVGALSDVLKNKVLSPSGARPCHGCCDIIPTRLCGSSHASLCL